MMKPVALGVLLSLAACTPNTIFDQFSLDDGQSARMDASQRLILVTNRGGRDGNRHVVCAEPSPDAIVSASKALSAAADVAAPVEDKEVKVRAALAVSTAQNAAFVGMRTQTIQLLRDGLYRACEAYMNGAIDAAEYNMLLINMPRVMTALIAIDGLTGRPAAPPVILPAPSGDAQVNIPPGADATAVAQAKANEAAAATELYKATAELAKAHQTQAKTDAVNGQQVADIAQGVLAHQTMPAICLSLLSRRDVPDQERFRTDPGFKAVLDFCRSSFKATRGWN